MTKIENEIPAFPTAQRERGMTLRDWFAGQALAGVIGVCASDQGAVDALRETGSSVVYFAKCAYAVADAMLLARKGLTE